MIETGTVIGNVSRTHHPCGACRALVETCHHKQSPEAIEERRAGRRQRLAAQMLEQDARRRAVDDFARQFRV